MKILHPASPAEIILGLKWDGDNMDANKLLEIKHLAERALALRDTHRKRYGELLGETVAMAQSMVGTGGYRAIRKIVWDLESDGPLGELLHALDTAHYLRVMQMLQEFRITGITEPFNALHANARRALE